MEENQFHSVVYWFLLIKYLLSFWRRILILIVRSENVYQAEFRTPLTGASTYGLHRGYSLANELNSVLVLHAQLNEGQSHQNRGAAQPRHAVDRHTRVRWFRETRLEQLEPRFHHLKHDVHKRTARGEQLRWWVGSNRWPSLRLYDYWTYLVYTHAGCT